MELVYRPRRLRRTALLRDLVRETRIDLDRLVMPYFVVEGSGIREEIESLPGNYHFSIDLLLEELKEVEQLGVKHIILFGVPLEKDEKGSQAWSKQGVVARALREIRKEKVNLTLIADVCLCQYTDHGHCGVLDENGVNNDLTLPLLARTALTYARAGADIVAPSDMMDGRVGAIRDHLDQNGYQDTVIMSYAAKFASAFYGPFRAAAHSTPSFGDRSGYQMDPANAREALREVDLDIQEGADIVMVKPALPCLDIIAKVRMRTSLPLAAYCVSGEYAMIELAARKGLLDREKTVRETLLSIFRAGADIVLTYWTRHIAESLKN